MTTFISYHHYEKLQLKEKDYATVIKETLTRDLDEIKAFKIFYPRNLLNTSGIITLQENLFRHLSQSAPNIENVKIYISRSRSHFRFINAIPFVIFIRFEKFVILDIMLAGASLRNRRVFWHCISHSGSSLKSLKTQVYETEMKRSDSRPVLSFNTRKLFELEIKWEVLYLSHGDLCVLFINYKNIKSKDFTLYSMKNTDLRLRRAVLGRLLAPLQSWGNSSNCFRDAAGITKDFEFFHYYKSLVGYGNI